MTATAWPTNTPEELTAFYGRLEFGDDGLPSPAWEGQFLDTIRSPYRLRLAWSPDVTFNKVRCHREVTHSLHRVLGGMLDHFGDAEAVRAANYDLFGGAYQCRQICGSYKMSLHTFGAAILLGPLRGPKFSPNEDDDSVSRIFEEEGWKWLGVTEGWGAIDA